LQSISNPIFSSQNFKLQNINELPKYEDLTHSSIPQPQEVPPVFIQPNYPDDSNEISHDNNTNTNTNNNSNNSNSLQMKEIDLSSDELEVQPVHVNQLSTTASILSSSERINEQIHSTETSKV
jgi:hypothetical protein